MTREEAIKLLECSATELVGTMMQTNEQTAVNQLQRYVDAYDMAIAALREQEGKDTNAPTKWISVEDRLPEEAERVLVRLSGDKPPIGEPRLDTDRVVDGRWVRWFDLVTHWMPLPEPPKEEV